MRLTGACGLLRHRHLVEILKDLADSAGQGIDLGLTVWRPVQENVHRQVSTQSWATGHWPSS